VSKNFKTARLCCRLPAEQDFLAITALYNNAEIANLSPVANMANDAATILQSWLDHWDSHGFGTWVIATKEVPDQIIACGGVNIRDFGGNALPNLWYRFAPDAWGKAYATEFAVGALAQFRSLTNRSEIFALVLADNIASIRILQKLGMQPDGDLLNPQTGVSSQRFKLKW
jgi:RimJ/RimL family protein N-acetyltransferase